MYLSDLPLVLCMNADVVLGGQEELKIKYLLGDAYLLL